MAVEMVRQSSLYSDHGGSDKVYNIQLIKQDGGYVVHFQNGKKGGTLASGTKTKTPVSLEDATKIFEKLEKEKRNGSSHYRPVDADANAYVAPVGDREASGLSPQLLTSVNEEMVSTLVESEKYCAQEKYDGERLQTFFKKGTLLGSNKLGFVRGIPQCVKEELEKLPDSEWDGELVGEKYYVFDATKINGKEIKALSYAERLKRITTAFKDVDLKSVACVNTWMTSAAKKNAVVSVHAAKGEGVVFKDLTAPYFEGRSKTTYKYKFTESATCIVSKHSKDKRSVYYGFFDGKSVVESGKVSIPVNHEIPKVGALIEVEYLYAFPKTNALSQAVYKGVRNDQSESDCTTQQLKFKRGPLDEEDEEVGLSESSTKHVKKQKL